MAEFAASVNDTWVKIHARDGLEVLSALMEWAESELKVRDNIIIHIHRMKGEHSYAEISEEDDTPVGLGHLFG